jgi:hypothetical protein
MSRETWITPFGDVWQQTFKAEPAWRQIAHEFRPLVERHGAEAVLRAWRGYLSDVEPRYASPTHFARRAGLWMPKTATQKTAIPRPAATTRDEGVAQRWAQAWPRVKMPEHLRVTWLRPTVALACSPEGRLTIEVPSVEHAQAVARRADAIVEAYNSTEPKCMARSVWCVINPLMHDAPTTHDGGL